jgi:hypothetical protein
VALSVYHSADGVEGEAMLDSEFNRQGAQTVRELAEKATDLFEARLVNLVARYVNDVTVRFLLAKVLSRSGEAIASEIGSLP